MGTVPAYQPDAEEGEAADADEPPEMMVAVVKSEQNGEKRLVLPSSFREKWASDPVRKNEWFCELQGFDSRLIASTLMHSEHVCFPT